MRYLLTIVFLVIIGLSANAQSLSLGDIISLATLDNGQANNNLIYGKPFKRLYSQDVNGLTLVHYQAYTLHSKHENVTVGDGIKTPSGIFLHKVLYTTNYTQNLLNLIAQAKSDGLTMDFHGSDAVENIYMFNNNVFSVKITINNDNSQGAVEVTQKDYLGY